MSCTVVAPALVKFLESNGTTHLFSAHTANGKDLFPRLSGLLNVSMVADILALEHKDGSANEETVFKRPIYAGNAILEVGTSKDKDKVGVVTVRTTAFDKAQTGSDNGAEVVKVDAAEEPCTFSSTGHCAIAEFELTRP